MKVLGVLPDGRPTVRPVVRQKRGFEIIGGENETEDEANLLTCNLDRFEAHMRTVHPDWQEFLEWVEDRRVAGVGYSGRQARVGSLRRGATDATGVQWRVPDAGEPGLSEPHRDGENLETASTMPVLQELETVYGGL